MNYNLSSPIIKRSVTIAGHSTSITMEKVFLDELVFIAKSRNISLNELVLEIDEMRTVSLSSACRLYVYHNIKNK